MALTRRKLMRLVAAGLSSAAGCAKPIGQAKLSSHFPTVEVPLTEIAEWYLMSIQGAYEADLARYRLKVAGLCDNELSLSLDALRAEFEPAEELVTLACVGNTPQGQLRSSSWFRGVRIRDVIARAGVPERVSGAWVTGLDGFAALQSMKDLLRSESLLAIDIGGSSRDYQPLPIEQGFPCRMLTPGLYGYMNPKWIDAITFIDQSGYQEVLTNSFHYLDGRIQLASGFSGPRGGSHAPRIMPVVGYAYGDGRAIAAVEVSVDGGPWQATEIVWNDHNEAGEDKPSYLWTLWQFLWDAPLGLHQLRCRARYVDGETQVEGMSFPYSGGSIAAIELAIEAPA